MSTEAPSSPVTPSPAKLHRSAKRLAAAFGFSTDELKEWFKSEYFRPLWEQYEQNHTRGTSGKKLGGEFTHVVRQLSEGEMSGNARYSDPKPDMSDWDSVDHQVCIIILSACFPEQY